ncbi:MAG: hypothetical protein A2X46_18995 [Lentisphaerae bacterium GWF2_57_35]|nr:MAG: hypothetical protein A2X46_18995 [Lentisphaerae bacterium GWF2_57_35]
MNWIVWLCRLALAAVFIGASIPKIIQPHDFALAVFRYQMAPYELVNLVALILPWIELTAGIALLLIPKLRAAANLLIAGMLAFFTVAISINLYRGIDIACGCFTVNAEAGHMGWLNLARNIALLAACAFLWWNSSRKESKV